MGAHGGAGRIRVLIADSVEDVFVLTMHPPQVRQAPFRRTARGVDAGAWNDHGAQVRHQVGKVTVTRGLGDFHMETEVRRHRIRVFFDRLLERIQHRLHGLQLWLALPLADEEIAPAFYHNPASAIPALTVNGVALRVLIGEAFGVKSPVKTFAQTLYVEAHLQPGQTLNLPDCEERAIYVAQGSLQAKDTVIGEHQMAVLRNVKGVSVSATTESRLAIIGGENLGPRFINWNFISSRKERIEQARQDWAAGRFAKVVGDEDEFIPLPE